MSIADDVHRMRDQIAAISLVPVTLVFVVPNAWIPLPPDKCALRINEDTLMMPMTEAWKVQALLSPLELRAFRFVEIGFDESKKEEPRS